MTTSEPRPRVLVVDDEPHLLAILASLLDQEGYSVATATTGAEAVDRARDEHFDVVVTDLKLPGMDGLETLAAIGRVDPATRPVVMTGFVSEETRGLLESKGYPYLLKPFGLDEIVAAIASSGSWDAPLRS